MTGPYRRRALPFLAAWIGTALLALPAAAVLDIEDRGPSLNVAHYNLRVTNCGILGNAFYNVGRSTDPSFEQPPGSGIEGLNYATLWVGGKLEDGTVHVSGGSLLEFRPTPDPDDRVRIAYLGRLGAARFVDDDNDGTIDEETLNDRDDDGDGEIDEDLGMFSQQLAEASFVDDRPEAVNYVYPGGEVHRPLGLTVQQEVFGWDMPGFNGAAGIRWVITNHSDHRISDAWVGIYADLDSRRRADVTGHLDDRVVALDYDRIVSYGGRLPTSDDTVHCRRRLRQTIYGVADRDTLSGLPFVTLLPLSHTIDGLANYDSLYGGRSVASAPRAVGFRSRVLEVKSAPSNGGLPLTDEQRYDAMRGAYPEPAIDRFGDWAVLVSCGPFPRIEPGQTIEINAALIGATVRDSIEEQMGNVAVIAQGMWVDRVPNQAESGLRPYTEGVSGLNGHESCVRPPLDAPLVADPHCMRRYESPPEYLPPITFPQDTCTWADA